MESEIDKKIQKQIIYFKKENLKITRTSSKIGKRNFTYSNLEIQINIDINRKF